MPKCLFFQYDVYDNIFTGWFYGHFSVLVNLSYYMGTFFQDLQYYK